MNKNTFLGGILGLIALFFIACSDDDNKSNTPTLRMDKTSFALPFNEDFLEATLYIDPMPKDKDLYELQIAATKLISGTLTFPSIAGINATQNTGEYKISIDRDGCIGTFVIELVDKQTESTVAFVSFDVEELDNEYCIYRDITIDLTNKADWDKEWEVDLKDLYNHYPGLNLNSNALLIYSPDKKEWSEENNFLMPTLNSQEKTLEVTNIIDETDANQPKGIWEFRLKGTSTDHKDITAHIYFEVK